MKNILFIIVLSSLSVVSASAREWEGNNGGRYGGCVVEGTLVTLRDGTQKPIERILENDRILTNTREDFAPLLRIRGPENIPLYRIRTTSGKMVVATEGHPFIAKKGMILVSKEVKVGMVLQTIDGPEVVASIGLVPAGKMVYNIIVASDEALRKMCNHETDARRMGLSTVEYQRRMDPFLGLSSVQHSYYINGIASGDLVIQQSIKN
jgi:hypothetical protein